MLDLLALFFLPWLMFLLAWLVALAAGLRNAREDRIRNAEPSPPCLPRP